MEDARTLDNAINQSGYSSKQVMMSVGLAMVLHVVVLSAYFIMGSTKKMSTPPVADAKAVAGKPGEGDAKAGASAATKDGKTPEAGGTKAAGSGDEKSGAKPEEAKKNTDTAKPNEIPSRPDSDIDDILKRK